MKIEIILLFYSALSRNWLRVLLLIVFLSEFVVLACSACEIFDVICENITNFWVYHLFDLIFAWFSLLKTEQRASSEKRWTFLSVFFYYIFEMVKNWFLELIFKSRSFADDFRQRRSSDFFKNMINFIHTLKRRFFE